MSNSEHEISRNGLHTKKEGDKTWLRRRGQGQSLSTPLSAIGSNNNNLEKVQSVSMPETLLKGLIDEHGYDGRRLGSDGSNKDYLVSPMVI